MCIVCVRVSNLSSLLSFVSVCMRVCMYVCMYACMYVCTYTTAHTHTPHHSTDTNTHTHTHTYASSDTPSHVKRLRYESTKNPPPTLLASPPDFSSPPRPYSHFLLLSSSPLPYSHFLLLLLLLLKINTYFFIQRTLSLRVSIHSSIRTGGSKTHAFSTQQIAQ